MEKVVSIEWSFNDFIWELLGVEKAVENVQKLGKMIVEVRPCSNHSFE